MTLFRSLGTPGTPPFRILDTDTFSARNRRSYTSCDVLYAAGLHLQSREGSFVTPKFRSSHFRSPSPSNFTIRVHMVLEPSYTSATSCYVAISHLGSREGCLIISSLRSLGVPRFGVLATPKPSVEYTWYSTTLCSATYHYAAISHLRSCEGSPPALCSGFFVFGATIAPTKSVARTTTWYLAHCATQPFVAVPHPEFRPTWTK